MTTFDDREQAYESKFAHDTDKRFREGARAVKMVAQWAAELMGKADEEADTYVSSLLTADFFEAGKEDVIRKLVADLGPRAAEAAIRAKLAEALHAAAKQIAEG